MRKNVDMFIKEHTYINYCECVIDKDGMIEYANPSHVETLLRATGESRDDIDSKMDIFESPVHWLTKYTGFVSVWTGGIIEPEKTTDKQSDALKKLVDAGLINIKMY